MIMNKKCINCGLEISEARLEVLPNTEFCVTCAGALTPRRGKLTRFETIQDVDEAAEVSEVPSWNERNPDVSVNSVDEEALKSCNV
jgi:hypothetical protein